MSRKQQRKWRQKNGTTKTNNLERSDKREEDFNEAQLRNNRPRSGAAQIQMRSSHVKPPRKH